MEQEAGLYAAAMERELSLVENAVLNLPFYNNALDTLQRTEPSESQAYWGTVLQARQYLDSIMPIFRFLENAFAYYPQSKLFLNNQINPQLTASVCAKAEQSEPGSCFWSCISTDSGNYLCLLYSVHSYYLGVWLSCDSLLNYICSADNTIAFPKTSLYYITDLENHPLTAASASVSEDSLKITSLVRHPGLYLNRFIPSAALETRGAWYHSSPTVVALLFLVLLVAVILSITHWVLIPIHSISAGIEKISSGDIGFRLSVGEKVSLEFAQITTAFNQMIDRLETMRIRIYEQELDQNETKLRYLSQQIQPHFILNSLNTLYTYSNRDVNETRKIIKLRIAQEDIKNDEWHLA